MFNNIDFGKGVFIFLVILDFSGEKLVENALQAIEPVLKTTGQEGQETLKQESQQLKSDWEALKYLVKETQNVLSKCLAAWNDFTNTKDKTKAWLDAFQKKVHK